MPDSATLERHGIKSGTLVRFWGGLRTVSQHFHSTNDSLVPFFLAIANPDGRQSRAAAPDQARLPRAASATWRTESTCVSCANFAVTDRHRHVWEARRNRNLGLIANTRLDPVSKTLAKTRIAECDRILADLSETGDAQAAQDASGSSKPL